MLLAYMASNGTGVVSPKYIEARVSVPFAAVDTKANRKTSGLPLASTVDLELISTVTSWHG